MTDTQVTLVPWERNPELLWEVETLAQEMAEAILKVDQWFRDNEWAVPTSGEGHAHLGTLAERLRAIGGNHA